MRSNVSIRPFGWGINPFGTRLSSAPRDAEGILERQSYLAQRDPLDGQGMTGFTLGARRHRSRRLSQSAIITTTSVCIITGGGSFA